MAAELAIRGMKLEVASDPRSVIPVVGTVFAGQVEHKVLAGGPDNDLITDQVRLGGVEVEQAARHAAHEPPPALSG